MPYANEAGWELGSGRVFEAEMPLPHSSGTGGRGDRRQVHRSLGSWAWKSWMRG